jgi:hypothetical protein
MNALSHDLFYKSDNYTQEEHFMRKLGASVRACVCLSGEYGNKLQAAESYASASRKHDAKRRPQVP